MRLEDMMEIEESILWIEAWVDNKQSRYYNIRHLGNTWQIVVIDVTGGPDEYNVFQEMFISPLLREAMNEAATWSIVSIGIDRMKDNLVE